ncbi:hypothetical protein GCM10025777_18520 [Membranihabitans marinus]
MSCVDNENKVNTPITKTTTDSIPVFNFEELEPYLYTDSDKTHIVNFWAMWCAPCVEELPIIQEYQKNNPNVDILLVSLDFPQDIETELKPFLKEKGITSKVVLLDDADANGWIDKIDPNWSGALPFTIIHNNKTRSYYEGNFKSLLDLENQIYKTINYADNH